MKKKFICLYVFIILIIFVIYAIFIEPNRITHYDYFIKNEKIPDSFDGFKIIHLTDIHYGKNFGIKKMNKLVKEINSLDPDIIVITGDFLDKHATFTEQQKEKIIDGLNSFKASIGKYIITGNHEHKHSYFAKLIEKTNFKFLDNETDIIYNESYKKIAINGYESCTYKTSNFGKNSSFEDDLFTISLLHEPDCIKDVLDIQSSNLVLSGHSHGGQVKLPFIGAVVTPLLGQKYIEGSYQVNGATLYVSTGIGVSSITARFMNVPSYNVYRLISL
ncbi:MAG: metallophosphoesterase [Bacilli bacterium]